MTGFRVTSITMKFKSIKTLLFIDFHWPRLPALPNHGTRFGNHLFLEFHDQNRVQQLVSTLLKKLGSATEIYSLSSKIGFSNLNLLPQFENWVQQPSIIPFWTQNWVQQLSITLLRTQIGFSNVQSHLFEQKLGSATFTNPH